MNRRLTEGDVGKTIFFQMLPMMIGFVSIMLYGIIDTYFVGKLGIDDLAAISFTFPVTYFVICIGIGLGVGVSAVVSRAIGENDMEKVTRLSFHALLLGFTLTLVISTVGLGLMDPIFSMLGSPSDLLPLIGKYMSIWFIGVPLMIVTMVGNNLLRAAGDAQTSSLVMVSSTVVNLLLAPILIFGWGPIPRLELQGAAIATACAWIFSISISLWILIRWKEMVVIRSNWYEGIGQSWKEILFIGLPATATTLLSPLAIAAIISILSPFGPAVIAAYGVGGRLESMAIVLSIALSTVMTPFVGQNMGAHCYSRVKQGVFYGIGFTLIWQSFVFLISWQFSAEIASWFTNDEAALLYIIQFLSIVPASYGFLGMVLVSSSTFNGLHQPLRATALQLSRLFILYIPFALIGRAWMGELGVLLGITSANILAGLGASFWIARILRKL